MIDKFTCIYKLYPNAVNVIRDDDTYKAFDKDNKEITISTSDINAEFTKQEYKNKRAREYPSVVDQLDLIYHSGVDAWKVKIKETKDKYPKS